MNNIVINVVETEENYDIVSIQTIEDVEISAITSIDNVVINSNSSPVEVEINSSPQVNNVRINVFAPDYTTPNSKNPVFSYTSGLLTRIDYSDSSYKILNYSGSLLSQVIHYLTNYQITKNFSYNLGILQNITETVG